MKISIIIPALNEEAGIGSAIDQIPIKKLNNAGYEVEILVVDNGSSDKTAEIAMMCGAKVVFQSKRGYGNAYMAGFAVASGDLIITGDADMTYPFDALPELLVIWQKKDIDFLNTDRLSLLKPGVMVFSHIWGNRLLTFLAYILFNWPFRDSQSGMWIFKRSIWKQLDARSTGMTFSQEIKIEAFLKGFVCAETPIEYRSRVGKVKLNTIRDGTRNILHLLEKRFLIRKK